MFCLHAEGIGYPEAVGFGIECKSSEGAVSILKL